MDRRTFLTTAAIAFPSVWTLETDRFYRTLTGPQWRTDHTDHDTRNHWHTPGPHGSLPHYRGPKSLCPFCT